MCRSVPTRTLAVLAALIATLVSAAATEAATGNRQCHKCHRCRLRRARLAHEYAIANGSIVRVGAGGQVCVNVGSVPGNSQAILDVTGYLTASALAQMPMLGSPHRVVDMRTSGGPVATGQSRCFNIAGISGVPGTATAVVLNVTAVGYGTRGWLSAYPAGQGVPATSSLNFDTKEYAMANGAVMAIGTGGQVCVNVGTVGSAPGSSQIIIDVVGYI
jgi:hypothetical protein